MSTTGPDSAACSAATISLGQASFSALTNPALVVGVILAPLLIFEVAKKVATAYSEVSANNIDVRMSIINLHLAIETAPAPCEVICASSTLKAGLEGGRANATRHLQALESIHKTSGKSAMHHWKNAMVYVYSDFYAVGHLATRTERMAALLSLTSASARRSHQVALETETSTSLSNSAPSNTAATLSASKS
ncbi:hypothetical protein P389DRAFT_212916 [Cystobasidium minutum MCA 4210]|uniref:uncharacterized protein n=1 Tax=Cystobasidium minutum MCA 4210 TaxID=1397322 RepID=UPI0034CDCC67|eukprot:jgi/Rhomi1/212916/estExt_Genemark1.C_80132